MYFDTDSFDFDSLTDVIGFDKADDADAHSAKVKEQVASNRVKHMGGKVDDISDLGLNVPTTLYDEDYEEENEEVYEFDDASDLTEELNNEANINSFADNTVYTLEDGSTLTGADLKELSRERNIVKSQSDWFSGAQAEYDKESKEIAYQLSYDKAAVDMHIEYLENEINSTRDDLERGKLYKDLRGAEATRKAVMNKAQDIMRSQQQRENMLLDVRHQKADYQLDRTFKGEYSKNKNFFTGYATKELGIPVQELDKAYSTGLMTAIMESWKFREQSKRASNQQSEFINKTKHAKSVQSANKVKTEKQTKVKADRALSNMGTSRQANVNAFAFIKD